MQTRYRCLEWCGLGLVFLLAAACGSGEEPEETQKKGRADMAQVQDMASQLEDLGSDMEPGEEMGADMGSGEDMAGEDMAGEDMSAGFGGIDEVLGDCDGARKEPDPRVRPGTDLMKYTLKAPQALCNDGSPAILYVRASATAQGASRWVFHTQAGGGCRSHDSCMQRWCGSNSSVYTAAKMSSRFAPEGIAGQGIFADRRDNVLFDANHVYFYYCSSDAWVGTVDDVEFASEDGSEGFTMHRRGHSIIEAALAELKAGVSSDDGSVSLPSLGDAEQLLVTGSSAGSSGAQQNVDYIHQSVGDGVEVRAVFDAAVSPYIEVLPPGQLKQDLLAVFEPSLRRQLEEDGAFFDSSCIEQTAADERWKCGLAGHVLANHITTPVFIRMDLRDSNGLSNFREQGFTPQQYVQANRLALETYTRLDEEAVEADQIQRKAGVFGPACGEHIDLTSNLGYFERGLTDAQGTRWTFQTALESWLDGADFQVIADSQGSDAECNP